MANDKKLNNAAVIAAGLDICTDILKGMAGSIINGALIEGHQKTMAITARAVLDKKEVTKQ